MEDKTVCRYDLAVEISGPLIIADLSSTFLGSHTQIYREIIDTQERKVREALIAMGWAPPPEEVPK